MGSNGKSSQWCFGQLILFWAEEKQQPLSDNGSLGLDYDFTEVGTHARIHFWVRVRLETKVSIMMQEARATRVLTPSQASQLLLSTSSSHVFSDVLVVADFNR